MSQTQAPSPPAPRAAAPLLQPGVRLGGRFEVLALHDRGGWGEVYRAHDHGAEHGEDTVAVKVFPTLTPDQERRVQREAAALRLATLPGVVRLLHQGRWEGHLYLALEWVEGTPLPRLPWAELEPVAVALLHTLSRLHDRGLVHRDLKPANILCSPTRGPVLVDLGLAAGEELGARLTHMGQAVGTAQYAAPEQLRGEPVDGRADLYALGVTLYESLTGRLPHTAPTWEGLLEERRARRPTPAERLVALPRAASALLERLLLPDPEGRPTAREALRILGADPPAEHDPLPWLGGEERLARVEQALHPGQRLCIGGRGAGCTRLLEEVHRRHPGSRWLAPAEAPYGSLRALAPDPPPHASAAEVRALLGLALTQAPLLLADPWERLDPWSQALLTATPPRGGLLASTQGPPDLTLPPLDEAALRELFEGPDLLLHLREDAAAELWRRTGGLPTAVRGVLRVWQTQGLAERQGPRWRLRRPALDRLRAEPVPPPPVEEARTGALGSFLQDVLGALNLGAVELDLEGLAQVTGHPRWAVEAALEQLGPARVAQTPGGWRALAALEPPWTEARRAEARAAAARALPPGSPGRLELLLPGGSAAELGAEALARALTLERAGRLGEAISTLQAAWEVLEDRRPLQVPLVRVLLTRGRPIDREQALSAAQHWGAGPLLRLIRAVRDVEEGDRTCASEALQALGPLEDPGLETRRLAALVRASAGQALADQEALLNTLWAHPLVQRDPAVQAQWTGWLGLVRHRQRRFAEAAQLHTQAAAEPTRPGSARVHSWLNAARSLLEAGLLEQAAALARRAAEQAAALRLPVLEAQAVVLLRAVLNREGAREPNLALVAALEQVDPDAVNLAVGVINEAFIALRGQHPAGPDLAQRAARAFAHARNEAGRLHAEALLAWAAERTDAALAAQACAPQLLERHPEVALEVLALHAPGQLGALSPAAQAPLRALVQADPARIRGLLSAGEAFARLAGPEG